MTLNFFLKQTYLESVSNPTSENFAENNLGTYNQSNKARNMKSNVLSEKHPYLKTSLIRKKKPLTISKCGYNVGFTLSILILYLNNFR